MDRSEIGRQLVRFAKGVPKTMSKAAMKQRKKASKAAARQRTLNAISRRIERERAKAMHNVSGE